MTDADYARLSVAHHAADARLDQARDLARHRTPVNPGDLTRYANAQRALGDLWEALCSGHTDLASELALVQAVILEWQVSRLEDAAACCCPVMPGVPEDRREILPECRVHGERAA